MKLRTVLISVVVSAALVGGAGYGAYYATQSQKSPVEVVPVSNVSQGYWGMDNQQIIYGSVTSQVAQTVQLNEEYGIDKIYVKAGDEVKEGTPLFSYDMTLQELELEMQQLELQTNELTLTRLEKELEKLKKTPATASLQRDWFTLTASAEESAEEPEGAEEEPNEQDAIIQDESEDSAVVPSLDEIDAQGQTSREQGGVKIDEVEKINGGKADAAESTLSTVENSVLSFEGLVLELQATFLTCGDELKASDVGEAIEQAVLYYRKHLADEKRSEEAQDDGAVKEILTYELKDAVKAVLNKEEIETLKKRYKTLNEYQVRYVQMLIAEAEELDESELPEAIAQIENAYDLLPTKQQDRVGNIEQFEELKKLAEDVGNQSDEADGSNETGGSDEADGSNETGGSDEADGSNETGGLGGADGSSETDGLDEVDGSSETDGLDEVGGSDEAGEPGVTDADQPSDDVRQNTVTFDVSDGATVTVDGQDATNSFAMAENGKIVFGISLENGYEITEVLVDGSIPARKNEESDDPTDYIIEGIQTNDTIVSVRTQLDPNAVIPEEDNSKEESPEDMTVGIEVTDGVPETIGISDGENPDGETTGGAPETIGTSDGEASDGESTGEAPETTETTGEETPDSETTDTEMSSEATTDGDDLANGEGSGTEDDNAQVEKYTVTINPGSRTETYEVGRLVPLQADLSDVTLAFMGWSVAATSGNAEDTVELNSEDVASGYASFLMPGFDVTATARYENVPDAIESYVATFLSNAEKLLAEDARQTYEDQGKDYLTELESAIIFYQQWLSDPEDEVLDESQMTVPDMEKYQLLDNVSSYLTENGKKFQVTQLKKHYRELCLLYAKSLFEAIDPSAIDRELLEKATDTYNQLGENWRKKLEKLWKDEQADLAEQNGQPWEENKKGKRIAPDDFLGIGEMLEAYAVMQMFQEFLNLPQDTPEEDRYDMALDIWSMYSGLSDAQKFMVNSDPLFAETFEMYGLWDEEPETEFPYFGDDYFGDFGDFGDEPLYTAEELAEMIKEKEQEIESCSLDIRQSELDVKQRQRVVDGKVVKSTMDGTVVSIGDMSGESDEDYFVKVTNEVGLYARGAMNELTLEQINVGDTISGMLQTNGTSFTAVIKEISEYPDTSGNYMSYGQENTNASYYPFYALIDDTDGLEEGDAEIYLSGTAPGQENGIYLENFFVRSEPDGRTYVYKKGDDEKLTKQYVKTGKNTGYSLEIKEGLSFEDSIAFPYGKDVKEGAKTKDVDQLQDAYM